MSQEWFNLIETCIFAPLLTALTGVIISFINKQAIRFKEKFNDEKTNRYIELAERIVGQAVTTVSQTYVDELKRDGVFTKEEQKKAFEKSKTLVYGLMKDECKKAIEDNYVSYEKWLETKIEETINNNK